MSPFCFYFEYLALSYFTLCSSLSVLFLLFSTTPPFLLYSCQQLFIVCTEYKFSEAGNFCLVLCCFFSELRNESWHNSYQINITYRNVGDIVIRSRKYLSSNNT